MWHNQYKNTLLHLLQIIPFYNCCSIIHYEYKCNIEPDQRCTCFHKGVPLSFPLRAWQKQQEKTELPKESEIQRDGISIVLFDKSSPMLSSNGNKLLQIGK